MPYMGMHTSCMMYSRVEHILWLKKERLKLIFVHLHPILSQDLSTSNAGMWEQSFFHPIMYKVHSFSSLSEKTRKSEHFADVMTKVALSSQLFKDPECWSGRGSNPWPPALQTSVLPTELTRGRYYGCPRSGDSQGKNLFWNYQL